MEDELEEQKTFYDLLCDGVEVKDLVAAVREGKVRVYDKFGFDNQVPSEEDKKELLDQLDYHYEMIQDQTCSVHQRSDDYEEYWQAVWPFIKDWGADVGPLIDRAWIVGKAKKKAKSTNNTFDSKSGKTLADKRHAPGKAEKEKVRSLAIPLIEGGNFLHTEIAKKIENTNNLSISHQLVLKVIKEQCYAMGKHNLVRGLKTRK